MSKGPALALVGLGVLALTAVARSGKAAASNAPPFIPEEEDVQPIPQVPDPVIEDPSTVDPQEPAEPAGPTPGPGSGSVPMIDLLPNELKDVDLSGNEEWSYRGVGHVGSPPIDYHIWDVANSLNGMPLIIFVGIQHPQDWIAFFVHTDPPGSSPAKHNIVFKISPTASHQHQKWMLKNIAGINE